MSFVDWVKMVLAGAAGTLLYATLFGPWQGITTPVRCLLIALAVAVLVWFVIPWLIVGLTYLVWLRLGRAEEFFRSRLLKRFPSSHYLRTRLNGTYGTETVYAVTAYVLHPEGDKLLMIKHDFHGRFLPPGGRLHANQLHHEAVLKSVKAETGLRLQQLDFCQQFCPVYSEHIVEDVVRAAPRPWIVQSEEIEQRGGMSYHYDFIYVVKAGVDGPLEGRQNPQWLDLAHIDRLPEDVRPFPNVRNLCETILQLCAQPDTTVASEKS